MNEYYPILAVIAFSVILLCFFVIFLQRCKTREIMKTLDQMLDHAIDGTLLENTFDESLLSSLEGKLNQYLAASETSTRNITREKEKIEELLMDISHQTKTPVANILLYAQSRGKEYPAAH